MNIVIEDCLLLILGFCEPFDFKNFLLTCKRINKLAKSNKKKYNYYVQFRKINNINLSYFTFTKVVIYNSSELLVIKKQLAETPNLPEITHIKFSDSFDEEIPFIPSSVICLEFGKVFNKPISNILPSNLLYLRFGKKFNKRISLPNSLIFLEFGKNFRSEIYNIPPTLKYLQIPHSLGWHPGYLHLDRVIGNPQMFIYVSK